MHNAVYEKEALLKDTSYRDTIFKTKLLALCEKGFSFSNSAKIKKKTSPTKTKGQQPAFLIIYIIYEWFHS